VSTQKHLSREEEERLIALSIIPFIPILLFFVAHVAQLKSMGAIASFSDALGYVILAATLLLATACAVYEVASSFKIKEPLSFRVKRFLSRALFFSAGMSCFYAFWFFYSSFLLPVLRVEYVVLLSLLSMSLTYFILVKNPKTRRLIKKLVVEQ
jgi:hypothetical protein